MCEGDLDMRRPQGSRSDVATQALISAVFEIDTTTPLCHSPRMQQSSTNAPPLIIALDQAINHIKGSCSDEDVPVRDLAEWQKAAWLLTVLRNSAATFALNCEISGVAVALLWLAKNYEALAAGLGVEASALLDASGQRLGGAATVGSHIADELKSKARIWRAAVNVGRLPQGDDWTEYSLQSFLRQDGAATVALFAHTTAKLLQMLTQARSQQEAQAAMFLVSTFAADTAYLAAEVAQ
jgi:hypothetical protein